ncbi:SDR family oxidoreductase [Arthrobacter sp. BHU FT2]|nr:SDR family oxidoreductase [Arthrobacter sp. BHU FT2]
MNTGLPGRFTGRTALVTGASGGIGRAVAARLATEGATVWATDLTAPADQADGTVHGRALDVTDEQAWETLVKEIEDSGQLDALYLCHGISQPHVPTLELTREGWEHVQNVNLTSCFLGIKAAAPGMIDRGYGRIVALASIAAKEASAGEHTYAASKAGLVALVKSVGKELATTGVTVNSIAPGPVETELWNRLGDDLKQDRLRRTPMGRPATPDEVASLALWLGSEEASYSTAQCFDASGGRATF